MWNTFVFTVARPWYLITHVSWIVYRRTLLSYKFLFMRDIIDTLCHPRLMSSFIRHDVFGEISGRSSGFLTWVYPIQSGVGVRVTEVWTLRVTVIYVWIIFIFFNSSSVTVAVLDWRSLWSPVRCPEMLWRLHGFSTPSTTGLMLIMLVWCYVVSTWQNRGSLFCRCYFCTRFSFSCTWCLLHLPVCFHTLFGSPLQRVLL